MAMDSVSKVSFQFNERGAWGKANSVRTEPKTGSGKRKG